MIFIAVQQVVNIIVEMQNRWHSNFLIVHFIMFVVL